MAQIVNQLTQTLRSDGIAVALAYPNAMKQPIASALAAGIPVVSFNSGSDVAAEMGVLSHCGLRNQETLLGRLIGTRSDWD